MEDAGASQKVLRERAAQLFLCAPAAGLTGNVLTKHKRLQPIGRKVATPLSGEKSIVVLEIPHSHCGFSQAPAVFRRRRRGGPGAILERMKLLLKWILSAVALLAVAYLYSGVTVTSFTGALIAAAVLGALNMVVRPLLVLLTLPVTVVTLGLFLFVVNALMFWAAASLVSGLNVNGFGAALLGSLIYSVLQLAIDFVLERLLFKD
jgi:putative membrane protein